MEKAARGEKGLTFPWGDQPDRSRVNIGLATLLPAGAFPKGASPYGALQMIGNAWEWVNDPRSPSQEDVDDFAERVNPRWLPTSCGTRFAAEASIPPTDPLAHVGFQERAGALAKPRYRLPLRERPR